MVQIIMFQCTAINHVADDGCALKHEFLLLLLPFLQYLSVIYHQHWSEDALSSKQITRGVST